MGYDRYKQFRQSGDIDIIPYAKISNKDTDFIEVYKKGETRLDILSYNYYNDSSYDWLIMQANPQYGSMEFDIPDGAMLRIPYPLIESLNEYREEIDKYIK